MTITTIISGRGETNVLRLRSGRDVLGTVFLVPQNIVVVRDFKKKEGKLNEKNREERKIGEKVKKLTRIYLVGMLLALTILSCFLYFVISTNLLDLEI